MTYQPLQKIILFDRDEPVIGYIPMTGLRICTTDSGTNYVLVTSDIRDARTGCNRRVRADLVQPYSTSLWAACARWSDRNRALEEEFQKLRHGHISADLQMPMFGER